MPERVEVLRERSETVRSVPAAKTPVRRSRISRRPAWLSDFAVGAALPLLVLIVWETAGALGYLSSDFLPTPLVIAEALRELAVSGQLAHHLGISVWRAALGFVIGGGLGLLFGLWAGFSRRTEHVVDPSIQMLRLVPHLAIAPLIILWFGFGEVSKVLIIAKGAFFPLYIHTLMGIRGVDNKLFEVTRVLGFSRSKQIVRLVIPAAMPGILLGLRLSLALSWLGLVVAELLGSQAGIGFLINVAKQNSVTENIFVGVIIFAVVGKLVDSLVRLLERRLLRWRDGYLG
ncbi:ABC transporter permease [Paenibacillus daejeonensis]|uniref:ABC transporter permease n=1 Tax=Paenibacillus daejeonensis TaxID=135193 RepID=UPI00037221F8|nr:ABC transporter permease [Paenibacillus daejeonensis]